jgi:hypothetical protein
VLSTHGSSIQSVNHHSKQLTIEATMLESLTLFTKGGRILFQYRANPSLTNDDAETTRAGLNHVIQTKLLLNGGDSNNSNSNNQSTSFCIVQAISFLWIHHHAANLNYCAMATYPDIMFDGPRHYLKTWSERVLQQTIAAYDVWVTSDASESSTSTTFDACFDALLKTASTTKTLASPEQVNEGDNNSSLTLAKENKKSKGGKEKRQWHDGTAKVTKEGMLYVCLCNTKCCRFAFFINSHLTQQLNNRTRRR